MSLFRHLTYIFAEKRSGNLIKNRSFKTILRVEVKCSTDIEGGGVEYFIYYFLTSEERVKLVFASSLCQ